uniref:Uncharacterized protein n=1 Tax=Chromera velia CCMP2878 TaxID=1169474 RepID=A0A0G4G3A2_9ALVE|eukprot:Cvel_19935.t1-p1 / transcript=Cvel_19935.t1 / gene=Cvel_19935 / organism=Chromera_velia_CCMP2878 / gene_product=hypothetical protein / transcript_product=hypothetical protein / location=Cvel_scaffold1754:15193-15660(+) / protein_length=156 / sequence_SO=supercontig / SO=protein_coding / is_pseudo=false
MEAAEQRGRRVLKDASNKQFHTPYIYKRGDYVWARVKRTKKGYAAKLTTKYKGPFRILEIRDNRTLLLKQPGAQTRRVINRDNAKPFVHRDLKENDALLFWFMPELEEDGKQADPIDIRRVRGRKDLCQAAHEKGDGVPRQVQGLCREGVDPGGRA